MRQSVHSLLFIIYVIEWQEDINVAGPLSNVDLCIDTVSVNTTRGFQWYCRMNK
jgi:hypothetical protein